MLQSTYIPNDTLGRWVDIPFNLSETRLYPASSILVASIRLPKAYRLSLRWLGLQFVDVVTQNDIVSKLTTNMSTVYAGLYAGNFERLDLHSGRPLVAVQCEVPSYIQMNPYYWRDFESPDTYAILAVNNTQLTQVRVSVTGTFRVTKL